MFRSMSNFKGMTFDGEEEDPGSCISNAAIGFNNEEKTSFFNTSIPHDNKDKPEFSISPYGSTDNVSEERNKKDKRMKTKSQTRVYVTPPPEKTKPSTNFVQPERLSRQDTIQIPLRYRVRKSPVRELSKGISVDSYQDGQYFRDKFGNIYVHKILPRAATVDSVPYFNAPGDEDMYNYLKESFHKWRRNARSSSKKSKVNSEQEREEISNIDLTTANVRSSKSPTHRLERGKRITDNDNQKRTIQNESSQKLGNPLLKKDEKRVVTTKEVEMFNEKSRRQRSGKRREVASVLYEQGTDKKGNASQDIAFGLSGDSVSNPSDVTKTDSTKPRKHCFTSDSYRYFTIIEDDTKKYVSSVNWKLK